MDRRLSYIDANPDILDLLLNARFALEGLAKLSQAVFGPNAVVADFTCAPTSPASMTVNVGPGQVYQMAALESVAISALDADTHQVLKQGVAREITPLTLVAPATVGTAVNVLIEVAYSDDRTSTQQVFNYYNAANPDIPLTGVSGNNQPQTSVIRGVAQIQTKYGVPATAGSQTTPAPDAGFAPLFVVTLTQGQTAISGNIVRAAAAPFVADVLQSIPAGVQTNRYTGVVDTGSVNALVVAPVPALAQRPEFTELLVKPAFTSTSTTPTIYDGISTVAILKRDGSAPAVGDIIGGVKTRLIFDGTAYRFSGAAASDGTASDIYFEIAGPASGTLTPPTGYTTLEAELFGAGGPGGGSVGGGASGSAGGGGGGRAFKRWTGLTSGLAYSVPGQPTGGASGGGQGTAGGTTTLGTVSATGGGAGSYGTNATGGAGGSGSGGDYNQTGLPGGPSVGTVTTGGSGGNAPFGGGSGSVGGMGVAGGLGGGGGGGAGSATASAGAAGGAGLIRGRWKR